MVRNHHQNSSTVAQKSSLIMCSRKIKMLTTPHHHGVVGYLFAQGACKRLQVRTTAWKHRTSKSAQCRCPVQEGAVFVFVFACHFPSGSFRYISTFWTNQLYNEAASRTFRSFGTFPCLSSSTKRKAPSIALWHNAGIACSFRRKWRRKTSSNTSQESDDFKGPKNWKRTWVTQAYHSISLC